jgi:site-specific recombinase XerD
VNLKNKPDLSPNGLTEAVKGFEQYLKTYPSHFGRPRSQGTIVRYMQIIGRLAEWLKSRGIGDFKMATAKDLEEFVINYDSRRYVWASGGGKRKRMVKGGSVKWQYRNLVINVLRLFYKWLYRDEIPEGYPPCVRKLGELIVKPRLDERSRVKSSDDLLTDEELLALLRACEDASTVRQAKRDKALIAVLYETGCRLGEIVNLKNKDVKATEYGFKVTLVGKTGMREVPLVDSAKYLLEWANVHPRPNDPEAPLFVALSRKSFGEKLTSDGVYTLIKKLARRAQIKKHVFPHLFRHTRATELTAYTSEAFLRKILGWSKSSTTPAVYIHLSGRDVEREVLRIHGIVPEEQLKPILEEQICPSCKAKNDPHVLFCTQCGSPLKNGAKVIGELSAAYEAARSYREMEKRLKTLENAVKKLLEVSALFMGPGMKRLGEEAGIPEYAEAVQKEIKQKYEK